MLTCLRGPQGRLVLPIGSPSQNKEFTYLLTYLLNLTKSVNNLVCWSFSYVLIRSEVTLSGEKHSTYSLFCITPVAFRVGRSASYGHKYTNNK